MTLLQKIKIWMIMIPATSCVMHSSEKSSISRDSFQQLVSESQNKNTYIQPDYRQPIIQQPRRRQQPAHYVEPDPECDCIAAGAVSLGLQAIGPALLGCNTPSVIVISVSLSTFAVGTAIMSYAIERLQREDL